MHRLSCVLALTLIAAAGFGLVALASGSAPRPGGSAAAGRGSDLVHRYPLGERRLCCSRSAAKPPGAPRRAIEERDGRGGADRGWLLLALPALVALATLGVVRRRFSRRGGAWTSRAIARMAGTVARELTGRQRVAMLLACACVVCVPLVLAPIPAGLRSVLVLPVALLAPGLCVTRRVGLWEPLVEASLAFPISAALWVLVAQTQIYLHAWQPKLGLVALLLASAASLVPELRRPVASADPRASRRAR